MTKKAILKKVLKISSYILVVLVSIPLLLFLALKSPKVQTFVVHEVTNILSEKFKAKISIESVDYAFFNKLRLNKVFVQDQQGDTLLYANRIYASLRGYNLSKRFISLGTAELNSGKLYLMQNSKGVLNLQFIIDALKSKDTTKTKGEYSFKVRNFKLVNFAFKYHKWKPVYKPYGMNYTDLDIKHINIDFRNIRTSGSKIAARIENISAFEKCGFWLKHLGADVDFSPSEIKLSNAEIVTVHSHVKASHIIFKFKGFNDWTHYTEKVRMDALFNNSYVDFKTIAYFAPTLSKWNFKGYLDGRVRGPVSALRSDYLEFKTGDSTKLALNFSIVGLPHAEQTVWKGNVQELTSNGKELGQTIKTFIGTHGDQVADIIAKLGSIKLNAYFSGRFAEFTSSAEVFSSIGNVVASLDTKANGAHTVGYTLNTTVSELNLGAITGSKLLGSATGSVKSEGNTIGRLIKSSASNANMSSIVINGYDYKNVNATIDREGKLYSYIVKVNSKDADLTCAGSYNFTTEPSRTIASVKVNHLNPYRLNLVKRDTISSIKGLFNVDFTGASLDDLNGSLTLNNATFSTKRKDILISNANINIQNKSNERFIKIASDIAEGTLRSNASLSSLSLAIQHFTKLYFPNLAKAETSASKPKTALAAKGAPTARNEQIYLNLRVKNFNEVLNLFIPKLKIEKQTTIVGSVNASNNSFDLKLISPLIALGSNQFQKVNLQAIGNQQSMRANLSCAKYQNGGLTVNNIALESMGTLNRINTSFAFNNSTKDSKNEGNIRFVTLFTRKSINAKPHIEIGFNKSLLTINDTPWKIGQAVIGIDSTTIDIEDFKITNQQQKIAIAGKISTNINDQLHFIINSFDVQNFKFLFQNSGYDFQGSINGIATLKNIYNNPMLFSNVKVDDAFINGRTIGSPELVSSWDEAGRKISILSTNTINEKEVYRISGTIAPESKDVDLDVAINQLRPFLLEPFTKGIVSNLRGNISAKLRLTGKTDRPIVNGIAYLENIQAKVDFLNTTYSISSPVYFTQNEISIKNDTLKDAYGNKALVNALVTHSNLQNFKLNIDILPEKLLALNTTAKQNQTFYGTAYASGSVKISGDPKNIAMRISAVTEPNSKVIIPISNRTQVQDQSFITFVQRPKDEIDFNPTDEVKKATIKTKSNLKIYLDLQVTPEADAQILLDPGSGNILNAKGSSILSMYVEPSANIFQIRGTYTIQKGDFKFSLLNLSTKTFTLENGSTITWTGNPSNAALNVGARYKLRTSLGPLLIGLNENNNQRYNVDCKIGIEGTLKKPSIKLGVELPDADVSTQTLVQASLNTEGQMQKQFVSLLMFGQFFPEQNTANDNNPIGTYAGKGMATDLLFSQLSNMVSQISNSINFDIKYTPGTATTQQEYEFSGSVKVNDWVTVNGTVDVADNNKSTGRGVAGDYDVEVRLDKKDKVKFKMFSHTKQDKLLNDAQVKQGVGVYFQNQFNTFGELFRPKKKKKDGTAIPPKKANTSDSTKVQKK